MRAATYARPVRTRLAMLGCESVSPEGEGIPKGDGILADEGRFR